MGRTPAHARHTQTSYALYWSSRNHPGTTAPTISVRGNEPDHPFLGERITHPPQSWPSSNGRSPNRHDPFQRPLTCIASVTIGTDWGVSPGHQICPSVFIDTLRVAHEGASPWVPDRISLSWGAQHLYGTIEQDDPFMFGDAVHTVAPAGIIH